MCGVCACVKACILCVRVYVYNIILRVCESVYVLNKRLSHDIVHRERNWGFMTQFDYKVSKNTQICTEYASIHHVSIQCSG